MAQENKNLLARPVTAVGRLTISLINEMGAMFVFLLHGMQHMVSSLGQIPKVFRQVYIIGAQTVFLIFVISLFTGMVLGLQGYYTLTQFGSEGLLGSAVALSLIRELGPALTAIMITGRAGSAMTAEIGVMRISDQIDALEVMDINSIGYLVSPRITASLISFPLLTALFDTIGIIGGYVAGGILLGINRGVYFDRLEAAVTWNDVSGGFIKSFVFALIVAAVCCYKGYFAHMRTDGKGPEAVGNATTSAVVLSCILLLASDYVLTSFLL